MPDGSFELLEDKRLYLYLIEVKTNIGEFRFPDIHWRFSGGVERGRLQLQNPYPNRMCVRNS
jgi:hypothetical protein